MSFPLQPRPLFSAPSFGIIVLFLAPLGCRSASALADDPSQATIIYRSERRTEDPGVLRVIVFSTRKDSPLLLRPDPGYFAKHVGEEEMVDLLEGLEEQGFSGLPKTQQLGSNPSSSRIIIESAGRTRMWVKRIDRLGGEPANVVTFQNCEYFLITRSSATRLGAGTQRPRLRSGARREQP